LFLWRRRVKHEQRITQNAAGVIDLLLHHRKLLPGLFLIGWQDQIQIVGAHLNDA
jgi:hypothetical protein